MEWKRSEEEGKERRGMKKRNRRKFPGGERRVENREIGSGKEDKNKEGRCKRR